MAIESSTAAIRSNSDLYGSIVTISPLIKSCVENSMIKMAIESFLSLYNEAIASEEILSLIEYLLEIVANDHQHTQYKDRLVQLLSDTKQLLNE